MNRMNNNRMQIASYDEPQLKLRHDWGQISGGCFTG